ncbi:anthranilate phosphoribosyltransferase [candidate division WOR-1 bacterium RIFOXYA12_FULL_43_27]|uniref:Anthranilate phosphoribosyltransferase n=1 Tax=candidate division WOR-1 bacterium RIFOXYC2_FULL_46_14 TaxID=1802587 RepID=A0A1F4U5I2_UNCSA|nr:MAG: anthranilate phosphoribosyltransferase [candidate division WOR-1 bacterium RIFOXYA12_FULL_43_27]OGC20315.1 MAG: anthranilate phosphoribosyltransferase [candidate division WOR-1 bacterium RIFOXYB2_FULL_46_45]OGC31948.1 MAG: anthranilate phosphoribosyltransferase [candidate division WOR-1 bacterium RIFOXYA2_FULL_46_56]OGC40161.1 MAG: anthranilate phosphoribosyltransferase [candidate division WOR-1 bacterium RIFOXYC2_FULL_46_14]
MIKSAIDKAVNRRDLTLSEAEKTLNIIMAGKATSAQIAALLTALRMKGETIDEITGFAKAMRKNAVKISPASRKIVDACGTGGDLSNTFNISTVSALVAAGAGVTIAKHGNRSVSSKCGSADLLEALGVKIDLTNKQVERNINKTGFGFIFAPLFHRATKHVMPVRRELGIRTIFNILGPLTNPAGAGAQLLGVFSHNLTVTMAHVLRNLGVRRALVVHGNDGLDEISISKSTYVSELKNGKITNYTLFPEDVGLKRGRKEDLICGNISQNKRMALAVLSGKAVGACRDIVVFNAGAVIYVAGLAASIKEGVGKAKESIDSKAALNKLKEILDVH